VSCICVRLDEALEGPASSSGWDALRRGQGIALRGGRGVGEGVRDFGGVARKNSSTTLRWGPFGFAQARRAKVPVR